MNNGASWMRHFRYSGVKEVKKHMSMQSLRDGSTGIASKILVGLIIIVFAMFGMGSITTFLAPTPKVAEVNGEDITQVEMETAVERSRRMMIAQDIDPLSIDEDVLRDSVLKSLISRKLLSQLADDWNLVYPDALLDEEIRSTSAFQVGGLYNPEQFSLVVGSAGFSPQGYREELRKEKKLAQIATAITGSGFLPNELVTRIGSISGQTRDVAYLLIEIETLSEQVETSDQELLVSYQESLQEYETEETVDIEYVELKKSDLLELVDASEQELLNYFEDTKEAYIRPEERRLAHIFKEYSSNGDARAAVEKMYKQIIDGAEFDTLAKENSDDPLSAENGGDLGFSARGVFSSESYLQFEEVAFSLELNEISEPVETEFGFHLIKVLDIVPSVDPVFDQVKDSVVQSYRQDMSDEMFVARSSELSELAFESNDLQGPATALDLPIKTTGPVGYSATEGIAANPEIINMAFSEDLLIEGNNSDVIEVNTDHHVVIRVKKYEPAEIRSFDEVINEVRDKFLREKSVKLAEDQAKEIIEMLEAGSLTRYVADQFDLSWTVVAAVKRMSLELDDEIREKAFALPRPIEGGKSLGYAFLDAGNVAVISVTNVANYPEAQVSGEEMASLSRALGSKQGSIDYNRLEGSLLADASVEHTE